MRTSNPCRPRRVSLRWPAHISLVFVLLGACFTSGLSCLTWERATADTPADAWTPGQQGGRPQGVCRFASLRTVPMGLEVGKWEPPTCYFTATGPGLPIQVNGTATVADGYDIARFNPAECNVNDTTAVTGTGKPLPADTAVAGFRADGSTLGICLVPDGEGAGSLITGQLYINGPRAGQCCWSANYIEHCRASGYRIVRASPVPTPAPTPPPPPPPVPIEPVPEPLEPNAGIFAARLSFGAPLAQPQTEMQMRLTFETPNTTVAHYTPVVLWGERPDALSQRTTCTSSAARSCYTAAPFSHYCNMTGLSPATRYYYSFGDATIGMTSPGDARFSFMTPPAVGTRGPLRSTVVVYGDMGLDYSDQTRARLAHLAAAADNRDGDAGAGFGTGFDWVIHNGDISYADNHISSRTKPGVDPAIYLDWMDVFYANISAYATRKPYMLSPGNHEAPCAYGEYEARARAMPYEGSNSSDVQYYSYTVGQTHVVALSGEGGRLDSVNSTEIQWLEADLARASAARARGEITFIITHVHYPNKPTGYCSSMMTYCCANGNVGLRSELEGDERFASLDAHELSPGGGDGSGDPACVSRFMTDVNKYVEDLFVAHGVDLHITAHQHVYERTTPVYRYQAFGNESEPFPPDNDGSLFVRPKYPINVNNGCPGNVELQDVWMPRPAWSVGLRTNADGSGGTTPNAYRDFGFLRLTMDTGRSDNMSSLNVQYVDSRNGTVIDSFTILK